MRTCLALLVAIGCTRDRDQPAHQPPPQPRPAGVLRGAAGDGDLRAMVAELMAAKACDGLKGTMRDLRGTDEPGTATGVFWARTCEIESDGTTATVKLGGNGWQWADQTKRQAGGKFVVRQYVKFAVAATLVGTVDIGYDRRDHVASVWFSPTQTPQVVFSPLGAVDVDKRGVWSNIVGAFGTVVGRSPHRLAQREAGAQGTKEFLHELDDGFSATVALCTGTARFGLGRFPKGQLLPPEPVEAAVVPVQLEPGGLVILGPQLDPKGETIDVAIQEGAAHVALACADQAERVAEAYLASLPLPEITTLASAEVHGRRTLKIRATRCPVMLIATPLGGAARLTVARPPREQAAAFGGPLISCKR